MLLTTLNMITYCVSISANNDLKFNHGYNLYIVTALLKAD